MLYAKNDHKIKYYCLRNSIQINNHLLNTISRSFFHSTPDIPFLIQKEPNHTSDSDHPHRHSLKDYGCVISLIVLLNRRPNLTKHIRSIKISEITGQQVYLTLKNEIHNCIIYKVWKFFEVQGSVC